MYFPILALLYLLIPYASTDGCHNHPDTIGCPTTMAIDVINFAIRDFCATNFHATVPFTTRSIKVGTSWPGLVYSPQVYNDSYGNFVSLWANFRVDRTSNGDPYILDYDLCVSLLEQASVGNQTKLPGAWDCTGITDNRTYGGWGNTDFGSVFAEPICPPGSHCLPDGQRHKDR